MTTTEDKITFDLHLKIQSLGCIIMLPALNIPLEINEKHTEQQKEIFKREKKSSYLFHRKYH